MASIIKPALLKTRHESKLLLEKWREFVHLLLCTQAGGPPDGVVVDPLIQRSPLPPWEKACWIKILKSVATWLPTALIRLML